MTEQRIELIQFAYSHYNEKARWALDLKKVPHSRTTLLPGPHASTVKRLTGDTLVPVMRFGEEIVGGSSRIIDELEQRYPDPPLYPSDPALKARALEIQHHFDEEVGALVRRGFFSNIIHEPAYMAAVFGIHRNALVRAMYGAIFPMVRPTVKKAMGITDQASIDEAYEATEKALDYVAEHGGADGPLVGEKFSVADLSAAALLAPAAHPPDSPMFRPRPWPERMEVWQQRWADHPGTAWVHAQYRRHRPASVPGGIEPAT